MESDDKHRKQHISDHDLLIRIDQQLIALNNDFSTFRKQHKDEIDMMKKQHKEDIDEMKNTMATKSELKPVKAIAYSIVSVVGCAVMLAIVGSVIQ